MRINGRYIKVSISMQEYNSREFMLSFLRDKRIFHTPKASSILAEQSGVRGEYIASACYERCPECGAFDQDLASHPATRGNTLYAVYSYSTRIYADCQECDYVECNATWYSKTTRILQDHLADYSAPFCLEMEEQCELEECAQKYWEDQGKPKGHTGRVMNMHEKIELYTGMKQPGGFVYLGGARRGPRVIEVRGLRITVEEA